MVRLHRDLEAFYASYRRDGWGAADDVSIRGFVLRSEVVIHAMKMRPKYRRLLPEG